MFTSFTDLRAIFPKRAGCHCNAKKPQRHSKKRLAAIMCLRHSYRRADYDQPASSPRQTSERRRAPGLRTF